MIAHQQSLFEIKIALLGYVSVGKTTLLNALLRSKFGAVSMRRTTAGVSYFRLSSSSRHRNDDGSDETTKSNATKDQVGEKEEDTTVGGASGTADWSVISDDSDSDAAAVVFRTAEETLKEITLDNASLRESPVVQTKTFDVQVEEDLCEMRSDTKLVIVDIPGINEAGASTKYKDFVADKWSTFDCVIVVMDAKQGVNTEDQLELLRFVQENLQSKKKVPTIILGNKVDEPDDREQGTLVAEVRSAVEDIFAAPNREAALEQLVQANANNNSDTSLNQETEGKLFPAFIPISAIHAYIYQTASRMNFEQFRKFDKDLIERLGREVFGSRSWRKLPEDKKLKEAFAVVADQALYKQGIEDSNFDKFMAVFTQCVGGQETQRKLIAKQLQVARSLFSYDSCIAAQLQGMSGKVKLLGESVDELKVAFWRVYSDLEKFVSGEYGGGPTTIQVLAKPMGELVEYHKWAGKMGWKEEQTLANEKMKELLQREMETVFGEATSWLSSAPQSTTSEKNKASCDWKDLTAADWIGILDSILLLSYSKTFCESFGKEKVFLEMLKAQFISQHFPVGYPARDQCPGPKCKGRKLDGYSRCGNCSIYWRQDENCPRCMTAGKGHKKLDANGMCSNSCKLTFQTIPRETFLNSVKYKNGKFIVKHEENYQGFITLETPDSLSDPNHFGHLGWKYCSYLESQK